MKTKYSSEITQEMDGKKVTLAGWVHEIRDLGGVFFLILRDRDGAVQVTLPKGKVDEKMFTLARGISRESVVKVTGTIKKEGRTPKGYEVIPEKIVVLNASESPLPLDPTEKVPAELDTRLDARFMDLRRPGIQAIFRIKAEVLGAVRTFLQRSGFTEINTPKVLASATEGGTSLFPISYFDREAFLAQSPQLYKQIMMASGLGRVFEIAQIFRAEEHDTRKHLNEVISIDIEAPFCDHRDVMRILERLVEYTYRRAAKSEALGALGIELKIPKLPFRKLTYTEAVEMIPGEVQWGDDLSTSAEKALGEKVGEHYFITDWPTEIKPFYAHPYERNPKICKAFDLMHPKMELSSGAQRIHSHELLRERIKAKGLNPDSFGFYLRAFRYGMPPHAGWGLGLERLVMTMLNLDNIREVVLFPRDRNRLTP